MFSLPCLICILCTVCICVRVCAHAFSWIAWGYSTKLPTSCFSHLMSSSSVFAWSTWRFFVVILPYYLLDWFLVLQELLVLLHPTQQAVLIGHISSNWITKLLHQHCGEQQRIQVLQNRLEILVMLFIRESVYVYIVLAFCSVLSKANSTNELLIFAGL